MQSATKDQTVVSETNTLPAEQNKATMLQPMTASQEATAMLQMIKEVALTPGANVEAIRAMLDMQRQLTKDQAERAFNEAMAKMSAEMPRIKKRGRVEYLVDKTDKKGLKEEAFRHAKWEDIDAGIRPLLVKYGFSLSFTTEPRAADGGGLTMVGTLSHVDGHSRDAKIAVALDNSGGKNNIQGMGSSSSYGKRYVTCMLLNIITEGEDDDAQSAEPISLEEAAAIDQKLIETKADKKKFLKLFGVDDVRKIQRRDFKKASALLAAKASEKTEATTSNGATK